MNSMDSMVEREQIIMLIEKHESSCSNLRMILRNNLEDKIEPLCLSTLAVGKMLVSVLDGYMKKINKKPNVFRRIEIPAPSINSESVELCDDHKPHETINFENLSDSSNESEPKKDPFENNSDFVPVETSEYKRNPETENMLSTGLDDLIDNFKSQHKKNTLVKDRTPSYDLIPPRERSPIREYSKEISNSIDRSIDRLIDESKKRKRFDRNYDDESIDKVNYTEHRNNCGSNRSSRSRSRGRSPRKSNKQRTYISSSRSTSPDYSKRQKYRSISRSRSRSKSPAKILYLRPSIMSSTKFRKNGKSYDKSFTNENEICPYRHKCKIINCPNPHMTPNAHTLSIYCTHGDNCNNFRCIYRHKNPRNMWMI